MRHSAWLVCWKKFPCGKEVMPDLYHLCTLLTFGSKCDVNKKGMDICSAWI